MRLRMIRATIQIAAMAQARLAHMPATDIPASGRKGAAISVRTVVTAAVALMSDDYKPLSDMRASSEYRMKTSQNLLRRFWLETRTEAPLRTDQVNPFVCA